MWNIPDDQIVRIQNRIADVRETSVDDIFRLSATVYELIGTLETIIFDERNYLNKDKTTTVLKEENNG